MCLGTMTCSRCLQEIDPNYPTQDHRCADAIAAALELAWRDGWDNGYHGLGDIEDEWANSTTLENLERPEDR